MLKNKMELIKDLMDHELQEFTFVVYTRKDADDNEEYIYSIKGSSPQDEDWEQVGTIGGNPEIDYTEEYINCELFEY